jgi:hypothetical protein
MAVRFGLLLGGVDVLVMSKPILAFADLRGAMRAKRGVFPPEGGTTNRCEPLRAEQWRAPFWQKFFEVLPCRNPADCATFFIAGWKRVSQNRFRKKTERESKMKKVLMALLVFACAASFASAGVGINWSVLFGAYDSDAPNLTGSSNALLDSYEVTWQLIYAGLDDQADAPDLSNAINGWVGGDDDVWATRVLGPSIAQGNVTATDSTVWTHWMGNVSGDTNYEDLSWNTAGFVFQRVYQGAPQPGSWYHDSALEALNTSYEGSPALPQDFFIDTVSAGFQPDQQLPGAIPEPATMSLLGLGALVMAIRRRRA